MIEFRKRKTPNKFTEAGDAVEKFKASFLAEYSRLFRIEKILTWLAKYIK